MNLAQTGHQPAARHIRDIGVIHAKPGYPAEFKKFRPRIDEFADQVPDRLFALLDEALDRFFAPGPDGLLDERIQLLFFIFPMGSVLPRKIWHLAPLRRSLARQV